MIEEIKTGSGELTAIPRPYEEKAYKYADKQAELYRGLKEPSGGYANIVDAYIVGATENGIQWHKLKENPNDIPRVEGEYFICYQNEAGYKNTFILKWDEYDDGFHWLDDDDEIYDEGIIAWAEKPQFKE